MGLRPNLEPDMSYDKIVAGNFVLVGSDHLNMKMPCQDSAISVLKEDTFCLAVSDGAGSASLSKEGSSFLMELVKQAFLEIPITDFLSENTSPDIINLLIEQFREKISKNFFNSDLTDFACTLVCIIGRFRDKFVCFHIGDGAIISLGNVPRILSSPENGEYSNETYFVTSEDWQEHLRINYGNLEDGFVILMSDGVTPFAISSSTPFLGFLGPLKKFIISKTDEEIKMGLESTFSSKKAQKVSKDDKSMSWAYALKK